MALSRRDYDTLAAYWRTKLSVTEGDGLWDRKSDARVARHFNEDTVSTGGQKLTIGEFRKWMFDGVRARIQFKLDEGLTTDAPGTGAAYAFLHALHNEDVALLPRNLTPYLNRMVSGGFITAGDRTDLNDLFTKDVILRMSLSPPVDSRVREGDCQAIRLRGMLDPVGTGSGTGS